jgi:hypothetical protein
VLFIVAFCCMSELYGCLAMPINEPGYLFGLHVSEAAQWHLAAGPVLPHTWAPICEVHCPTAPTDLVCGPTRVAQ